MVHDEGPRYGSARIILNVFLCITFFVFSFSAVLLSVIRTSTSDEAIIETISEIDVVMAMEEYQITDMILASIPPEIVEAYDIRHSSLERLLEHPSVKDFTSNRLTEYISALERGDSNFTISKRDIIRFLERNESVIQNEIGYKLTGTDYQEIENYFDESEFLHDISVESILSNANTSPELFKSALSSITFIVLLVLCAGALFALIYLNRKYLRLAFLAIGVTSCAVDLIYTILGLSLSSIVITVAGGAIKQSLMSSMLTYAMSTSLVYGLIILATGVVLMVIYVLIKKTAKT